MKRRLPVIIALILVPVIAALMLRATRERDRLVPAQDSQAPEWLQCDDLDCGPRPYSDRQGRVWWRFNPPPGGTIGISIPAESFADGCEVAWFVRRGSPLLLRPAAGADPLPGPARNRVRPGKILFHRLTREALCDGAVIELADAPRLESLFLSFADAHVDRTEAGYVLAPAILGARGRSVFIAVSVAFILLAAAFAIRYRGTGSAAAGVAALAAAFALGAFWFDSPVWSRELRLDKGDDSFYLAYAQNLVNHGSFFRAPTVISFGARNLDHCHGLPGIALMLAPPLAARALPGNAPLRGNPVSAPELRAMRATSMAYALLATLLLFGAFRARGDGRAAPSVWDVLLPALLLWGTSLPRWAFVRSIFTHPAELALLCLAVFLASRPAPRRELLRDTSLAATAGLLFLVRGEYLPVALLFLLLPRRAAPATSGRFRAAIRRFGAPVLVLAAFACVYAFWVSRIGTGYGRPSDSGLPFSDGPAAVLAAIARNALILLRSFLQNGAILPVAAALAIAAPFVPALRRRAADFPLAPRATAVLAAAFFILNCCFSPPLGDEFGHRYALKLYPFALLWIGTLLAAHSGRVAHCVFAAFPAFALLANLRLLLRTGGTDLGQNFSMLSNLQFDVLPPSGAGAVNLRLAIWLLLAAWCAWLAAEALRRFRRHSAANVAQPPDPS